MEGEVDENEDGEISLECVYALRPWVKKPDLPSKVK